MPGITEVKVHGYHLDLYGHVNHARYLEFLEAGRWGLLEGPVLDWFMAQGYALVVTRIDIRYHRSATMGQTLRIETRLSGLQARSATLEQRVFRQDTGKLLTEAEVTIAVTHPDQPRAQLIDGEIAAQLQAAMSFAESK